jgi:CheY-like chemotaxis protein
VSVPESLAVRVGGSHPVRVLLVGNDLRFLRVASALLSSEGHIVSSSERPSELIELVHGLGTDVVVLDATRSLAQAARAAASLRGLPQPVATVLVADRVRLPHLSGLAIVRKWGGFHELSSRVKEAHTWRCQACA